MLKLEADKSGEDLNIFNSVPRKGNHLPFKWMGPNGLLGAEILPPGNSDWEASKQRGRVVPSQNIVKLWFCQWFAAQGL